MTAGYREGDDVESGDTPTHPVGRPGPLPPRTEHPAPVHPGYSSGQIWPPAATSGAPSPAGERTTAPYPAGERITAPYPAVPQQQHAVAVAQIPSYTTYPGAGSGAPAPVGHGPLGPGQGPSGPMAPGPITSGPITSGPMASGPMASGPVGPGSIAPSSGAPGSPPVAPGGYPYLPAQPPAARSRSRVLPALVIVLLVLVGAQGALLVALNGKVNRANHAAQEDRKANAKHLADLDKRTSMLEKQAAASLDPQAVAAAVLPSVFKVDAGKFSGTAFVIKSDDSGTTLLTNYHVVAQLYESSGRTVSLEHDSQRFNARIVKVNPEDDLAMLESSDKFQALTAVTEEIAQGAPVVVVGAPLGLEQSVTTGVVSAIRNDIPGEGGRTYIQFSAPINPGNSGGPVVNAQKQVVGIATAKAQDAEGIGLAIPISVACKDFGVC